MPPSHPARPESEPIRALVAAPRPAARLPRRAVGAGCSGCGTDQAPEVRLARGAALTALVGALLAEQHDEWAVARRYMTMPMVNGNAAVTALQLIEREQLQLHERPRNQSVGRPGSSCATGRGASPAKEGPCPRLASPSSASPALTTTLRRSSNRAPALERPSDQAWLAKRRSGRTQRRNYMKSR